jgi:two-component system phosphate regulon sensor histidine kinase PhoR
MGTVLTRSSRSSEWLWFLLAASLPAAAALVVALRAVRSEESALREQLRLELEHAAALVRDQAIVDLHEVGKRVARGETGEPLPFADRVRVGVDGELLSPASASAPRPRTDRKDGCVEAMRAMRAPGPGAAPARARLLRDCEEARDEHGRHLWLVVALDDASRAEVGVDRLAAWLDRNARALGAAEAAAARLELEAAPGLTATERARLLAKLAPSDGAERIARLCEPRRASVRAGAPRLEWRDRVSAGWLTRLADGSMEGYVVHSASVERALGGGWLTMAGARAEIRTAARDEAPVVALWQGGIELVVRWVDPAEPGRRAARSRGVLFGAAALAALLAATLAAILFARMRAARRLSALRTDFVAAVSHELRTPIASVRMLAELLAEGRAEPGERDEMYQALAREARRLGETVERLLGFSRMDAGKSALRRTPMEVAPIVAEALDAFEAREPAMPPVTRKLAGGLVSAVDAASLRMALDNLLGNARKFAPQGTPYEVVVERAADGVRVAVTDRGPGIARRDQKRIFRPFERADDRLSRATEGSGIGLSLVEHVARSHGGRVRVESEPGRGATFELWLPATAPAAAGATHEEARSP